LNDQSIKTTYYETRLLFRTIRRKMKKAKEITLELCRNTFKENGLDYDSMPFDVYRLISHKEAVAIKQLVSVSPVYTSIPFLERYTRITRKRLENALKKAA